MIAHLLIMMAMMAVAHVFLLRRKWEWTFFIGITFGIFMPALIPWEDFCGLTLTRDQEQYLSLAIWAALHTFLIGAIEVYKVAKADLLG